MLIFSKYTYSSTLSNFLFLQYLLFITELHGSVLIRLTHRNICRFNKENCSYCFYNVTLKLVSLGSLLTTD